MELERALYILATVHTRDDPDFGFTLIAGARPDIYSGFSQAEYMEAWKRLRMHLHMNVNPSPTPA